MRILLFCNFILSDKSKLKLGKIQQKIKNRKLLGARMKNIDNINFYNIEIYCKKVNKTATIIIILAKQYREKSR